MKFDILYSRLDPVYWDRQERRAQSGIYGCEQMGVPKFPYLSSNNGKFSKISFLFLYYSIKFEKSQMFVCNKKVVVFFPPYLNIPFLGSKKIPPKNIPQKIIFGRKYDSSLLA